MASQNLLYIFFLSINVVVSQAKPGAGVLRTNKGERWWSGNSVPDVSDHWRLPQVLASRPTVLDGTSKKMKDKGAGTFH